MRRQFIVHLDNEMASYFVLGHNDASSVVFYN